MLHGLAAPDWRGEIRVGRTIGSSAAATKQLTNNQRVVKASLPPASHHVPPHLRQPGHLRHQGLRHPLRPSSSRLRRRRRRPAASSPPPAPPPPLASDAPTAGAGHPLQHRLHRPLEEAACQCIYIDLWRSSFITRSPPQPTPVVTELART